MHTGSFTAEQVHELVMVAIRERDKLWVTAVMAEPDTHIWQRILERFNMSRPNPDPALQPIKNGGCISTAKNTASVVCDRAAGCVYDCMHKSPHRQDDSCLSHRCNHNGEGFECTCESIGPSAV